MNKNIICFLTVNPTQIFFDFVLKLKNDMYDVYVCIDDNNYIYTNASIDVNIIKLDNKLCEDAGFKSTVLYFNNKSCSRDKALYYFCKNNINFNYLWMIEEDVFIPSQHTIEYIDFKYPIADLLSQSNDIIYKKKYGEWLWNYVNKQIKIQPPYSKSMICAIRCSKKLLKIINEYAEKYKNLFLDEILFNTLALHNNLEIIIPTELSTILWKHNWKLNDLNINNLYHPIKNIYLHYEYRKSLLLYKLH